MKISIQIDGIEQALQGAPSGSTQSAQPAPGTMAATSSTAASGTSESDAGLQEMLARALAMGAIDAGPAPPEAAQDAPSAAPTAFVGGGVQGLQPDQSGGAAPGTDAGSGTA